MLLLAEDLVRRGHAVTIVLGSRVAEHAEAIGARFESLTGDADFDDRLLGSIPERNARAEGIDQLNWDQIDLFVRAMRDQYELVQRLLAEDQDASLPCNSLFLGA